MMDKSGGISLAGGILRAVLVLVTGYMTWSFLQTMMGSQAQIVAILGIAAFEGGMIYWEFYFNHVALSSQQTAISASLILIDVSGVALAFVGEVMINRPDVVFPTWLPMIALIGTTVVVICNVMAFIGVSVFSPHAALARETRQSQMARLTADVMVQSATAKQLLTDAQQFAVEAAPGRSAHEIGKMRVQYAVPAVAPDVYRPSAPPPAPNGVAESPFVNTTPPPTSRPPTKK